MRREVFAVHQSVSSLRLSRHLSPPPVTCKHWRRKLARKQCFVRKGFATLNMNQSQLEISGNKRRRKQELISKIGPSFLPSTALIAKLEVLRLALCSGDRYRFCRSSMSTSLLCAYAYVCVTRARLSQGGGAGIHAYDWTKMTDVWPPPVARRCHYYKRGQAKDTPPCILGTIF